jgi:hypothetical protein
MQDGELPDVLSCDLAYLPVPHRSDPEIRFCEPLMRLVVSHFSQKAYEAVVRKGEDV